MPYVTIHTLGGDAGELRARRQAPAIQAARDAARLPMPSTFQRHESATFELYSPTA